MAKKSSGGIGLSAPPAPRVSAAAAKEEKRWRAEDDLRTLRRAEEVRSDPSRVKMAKQMAAEEMRALARVAKK